MAQIVPKPRDTFQSPTTVHLLDSIPAFERGSVDIQAALDAIACELDRFEARMQEVLDNFFPQTADEWLTILEGQLGLPMNPAGMTLTQRQNTVLAFLRNRSHAGEGTSWVDSMNKLLGTGWTYEEHIPGDPSSPPAYTLLVKFPYSQTLTSPAGLAATAGSGGTLAAGTYHYVVTATNFYGETLASNDASATVAASGRVMLDWPDVTGATGYRVYRGAAAGGTYSFVAEAAVSAYIDDGSVAPDGSLHPPGSNTTESPQASSAKQLARRFTDAHIDLVFGYTTGFIFGVSEFGDAM